MSNEFIWVEKYRPKTIQECVLPKRIKTDLLKYVEDGRIPNLLFEGPAGTGKTSAAIALCEMVGVDYIKINSSQQRGIDVFRTTVIEFASTISLNRKGKVIILDEADGLTADAQQAFRGIVEEVSNFCTFILTCNFKAKLMNAIDSRTATYNFRFEPKETENLKLQFFKMLKKILVSENVIFEDRTIVHLIEKYFPDFRKSINEMQRLSMHGELNDITSINIDALISNIRDKEFSKARLWVAENNQITAQSIFREVYDGLYDYFESNSIPQAVLIINKYQDQHTRVADPEINLMAFLVELMVDTKIK